jgi:hypothetical protein
MPLTKNQLNKLLGPGNHKTQWRKLALKMHPNKKGNANAFKNVSAAYNKFYKNVEKPSASNASARMPMNASFKKAMNNFLNPKRQPSPPRSETNRMPRIGANTYLAKISWKGTDPIHVKLSRTPIIRFKNQNNINFFKTYSRITGKTGLEPNRNYYFISHKSGIPKKMFVLNMRNYSTSNNIGLANKNQVLKYFGL